MDYMHIKKDIEILEEDIKQKKKKLDELKEKYKEYVRT